MPEVMVGVDIGTTSTKAVAFTLDGRVKAHQAVEYPLLRPTPAAACGTTTRPASVTACCPTTSANTTGRSCANW